MNTSASRRLAPAVLLALLLVPRPLRAAEPAAAPGAETALAPLLRRIEALEVEQARLRDEIESLRRQLAAAGGERREVAPLTEPPRLITQNIRGEPFRGGAQARVGVIIYSDFNCSYCARFQKEIYPLFDRDYVQPGRVKFLFRDLPDRLDPDAALKAQAARCAMEQGRFWDLHDRLFTNTIPLLKNPAALELHALALKLDAPRLQACLDSGRFAGPIQRVGADARKFGIHGTPGFLIGTLDESGNILRATRVVTGAESYEAFRAEVDAVLAEAGAGSGAGK